MAESHPFRQYHCCLLCSRVVSSLGVSRTSLVLSLSVARLLRSPLVAFHASNACPCRLPKPHAEEKREFSAKHAGSSNSSSNLVRKQLGIVQGQHLKHGEPCRAVGVDSPLSSTAVPTHLLPTLTYVVVSFLPPVACARNARRSSRHCIGEGRD